VVDVGPAPLQAVLHRFLGSQTQIPPMYSALKRAGTPLYVLARRGETVDRPARSIVISQIELVSYEGDRFTVRVACSKGTYIRTLAEDIGAALGCGAHLNGLRRTATGPFQLAEAVSLDELTAMAGSERDRSLAPTDSLVEQLARVDLDQSTEVRFCQGQSVVSTHVPEAVSRVYGSSGRFLGLAERGADGKLVPRRLLAERQDDPPTS
jgi:tRNA pseudouridine55 synthase